ncbi:MAG: DMT family transporter [Caldilineaceae bacterium]
MTSGSRTTTRRGLMLAVGAAAMFSTAPILTRWVGDTLGPYEISFWRCTIGALFVLGAAVALRQPLPAPSEWRVYSLTGLLAALHFVLYIAAVQFTTIAHTLAIVYTAPVWTALAGLYLGERLTPRRWLGVAVAVGGVAVMVGLGSDPGATLFGDLLALGSAFAFAAYTIAGRRNRGAAGILPYAGTVYAVAALWTLPAALVTWSSGGYTTQAVVALIALGLLPLAVGHTLYNGALRLAPATAVNVLATQELTFGILLGALLLNEVPTATTLLGAVITIVGAILVIL